MKHSKVYLSVINAMNEEIADQTVLIDLIKTLNVGDVGNNDKCDVLDRELKRLFTLVHFKNELIDLIKDREDKGEF